MTGVPAYGKLVYKDLWPGIDLVYSGTVNQLKYEFIVTPGSDPGQIRLAYQGTDSVRIKPNGALEIATPVGDFKDGKPCAYQVRDGRSVEVAMNYRLQEDEGRGGIRPKACARLESWLTAARRRSPRPQGTPRRGQLPENCEVHRCAGSSYPQL